jgi:hypothetical protein
MSPAGQPCIQVCNRACFRHEIYLVLDSVALTKTGRCVRAHPL